MVRTLELASDCSRCFGLCCVLLPYAASRGFGADKEGGVPCGHLCDDDRCAIHDRLRETGWPGCTVFECFGAGQRVSQQTYAGVSWRDGTNRAEMAAVLTVMRHLHEALFHLDDITEHGPDEAAVALAEELADAARGTPRTLLTVDLDQLMDRIGDVLAAASVRLRPRGADDLTGADLAGRDLRDRPLAGASLRRAVLIGADLRGVDLTATDLLGADLRDADLRGAHARDAFFLTQPQANAARGDAATTIPGRLRRPGHW